MLKKDDQAPEIHLEKPDGKIFSLAKTNQDKTVLVFLRHLACLPCQAHLIEIKNNIKSIFKKNAQVIVISFDSPEQIAQYKKTFNFNFPILSDPERSAYQSYGLHKGSFWKIWAQALFSNT